jgi:hypothetical protein
MVIVIMFHCKTFFNGKRIVANSIFIVNTTITDGIKAHDDFHFNTWIIPQEIANAVIGMFINGIGNHFLTGS